MRVALKIAAVAAAAATALAVGIGPAALADPETSPSLTTLVGVGSDTITPLFDNGGQTTNDPGCTSSTPGQSGTFVTDYNATKPTYKIASWDAINPCTGTADETITAKAKNSSDTSCQLERPDGSSAGIEALNDNQTDTNKTSTGQTVYCIDFARSSRAPNTTTFEDAFVALSQDAISWTYPKVSGETNPQPTVLTLAQLTAIYNCTDTTWNEVGGSSDAPIGVVVPQAGSGTRSTFLGALGITATDEPCWQNGTVTVDGVSDVIEENTGLSPGNVAQFTTTQDFGTTCADGCAPADDIYPYSIGDWIAQDPATDGVGGHANSVWGHGNMEIKDIENAAGTKAETPVTKKSSGAPEINPSWNPIFDRILYVVTRNGCYNPSDPTSTAVCLPTTTPPTGATAYPTYEATGLKKFVDWACDNATAKADTVSYGFTNLNSKTLITKCGDLTAGD
jgi:ABC-type phosphate transport system substrate-binding protein